MDLYNNKSGGNCNESGGHIGPPLPKPNVHQRHSIRLPGYDYSQAGAYFVTVCTQDRECLFGEIIHEEMMLNEKSKMVKKWWIELENKFPAIKTDSFVIMPNHIHGIICIVGADLCVGPKHATHVDPKHATHVDPKHATHVDPKHAAGVGPKHTVRVDPANQLINISGGYGNELGGHCEGSGGHGNKSGGHIGPPLPKIVQWFKTMTTNEYLRFVKTGKWQPLMGRLWQRNYYEHIIRDNEDMDRIREYIITNPLKWELDKYFNGAGEQINALR